MRGKLVLFFILSITIGFIASANLVLADNGDVTTDSKEHHERPEHETAAEPVPAGFKLADSKPEGNAEANTEPEAKTETAKDETEAKSATVDDRATEASQALEWSLPSTDGQLSKNEEPESGDEAGSKPKHSTEAESTPEGSKEAHSTVDDDKEARNSASESSDYQSATSEFEESELSSTEESASNDPTSDKHGKETGSSHEDDKEVSSKAKDETDAESSTDGDTAVEGSKVEEPEASSDESRDHYPRTTKACEHIKDNAAITDKKGECNKCCEELHPHYYGDYRNEGGCVCHTKPEHRHLSRLLSQPILGEVPKEEKPEAGNEAEAESESEHKTEANPTSGGTTVVEPTPESATSEKPKEDITSEILKPESPKPEERKYEVHGPANAPQEERVVCKIDKNPSCLSCLFGTDLKKRCRKCCKKTHGREGIYKYGECVCGNPLPKKSG